MEKHPSQFNSIEYADQIAAGYNPGTAVPENQKEKFQQLIDNDRDTAKDVVDYLEQRPYAEGTDADGNLIIYAPDGKLISHDDDGNLIDKNAEKYYEAQRQAKYDETADKAYSELSFDQLSKNMIEAREVADTTKIDDIEDALLEKVEKSSKNISNEQANAMLGRVIAKIDNDQERADRDKGEKSSSHYTPKHMRSEPKHMRAEEKDSDYEPKHMRGEDKDFSYTPKHMKSDTTEVEGEELTIGQLEDNAVKAFQDFNDLVEARQAAGVKLTRDEYRRLSSYYVKRSLAALNAKFEPQDRNTPAYLEELSSIKQDLEQLKNKADFSDVLKNNGDITDFDEFMDLEDIVQGAHESEETAQPEEEPRTEVLPVVAANQPERKPTRKKAFLASWYVKTRERAREYFNDPEKGFRRRAVRDLGGLAILAATAWGISKGLGGGSGIESHAHHTQHLTPPHHPRSEHHHRNVLPNPLSSHEDLHQYTWGLAEHYSPKNPVVAINTALGKYNQQYGTSFHLMPYNGNEEIGQLVNGQVRIISPAEMYHLNELMAKLFAR